MIEKRLRNVIHQLRTTPMPLADLIPMLQEAADQLESRARTIEDLIMKEVWETVNGD